MTTYDKPFSPQESLSLITEAISKTKENIKENSFPFLLWGWLITIASFSYFLLQQYTGFRFYFIPFPVLVAAGIIATVIWYAKQKSTSATETYLNYFLSRMWLVLGINFLAVVFINVSQNLTPFTYTLMLAAIGTLVSGLIMKFTPLTIGGVIFLASALISIYIPDDYKALLHGVAMVAGYLIPGYLLKNKKHNGSTLQ
jgi:general stress protein CsbA